MRMHIQHCMLYSVQTFVYDNNLYFQPNPFTTPVQVTDNRGYKYVYNGICDWLYEGSFYVVLNFNLSNFALIYYKFNTFLSQGCFIGYS